MFLLLSLNIFHTFLCVSFVEFEQVDVSWDYSHLVLWFDACSYFYSFFAVIIDNSYSRSLFWKKWPFLIVFTFFSFYSAFPSWKIEFWMALVNIITSSEDAKDKKANWGRWGGKMRKQIASHIFGLIGSSVNICFWSSPQMFSKM